MTTLGGQSLFRHIKDKDYRAVISLLDTGTLSLDERDDDGQTFLMVACQVGDLQIVKTLLDHHDENLDFVDNDNWTALLNASKEGHADVVAELLDRNANIEHKDMGGWTALTWACYKGRLDCVNVLLDRGANVNVKGEHHMSNLTWAAGRGYTEIVKALLAKGAKVNTADKYGTTPLIWACRKGHLEIVEAILAANANVDNAGMKAWTALIAAANGGYTEVVAAVLEHHPNVNALDKDGYTALTLAAKDGHSDIVSSLLSSGAYVNIPDRYGDTILIHAVKGGHVGVVQALLKKYADIDVEGVDNKTALYWSVEKNYPAVAKILLDYHANTEIANKDGDTPLMKAVRNRLVDIVEMLLARGAKVSATDKRGDTALHVAVRGRSKRITELLLRNPKEGRLLYKPNKSTETPYQLDAAHSKGILTQIFGARHLNSEESIKGYDLYSSTIADVLSEPSLTTPITIGLYAKWGSGKSFLISKLQREMKMFTQHSTDPLFEFSFLQFFLTFFSSIILGGCLALALNWYIGVGVGAGVFLMQYIFFGIIWFGTNKKDWERSYIISVYLAKKFRCLQILMMLMFCNEWKMPHVETAPVRFLFTDNHRLARVVGVKSIVVMICTLSDALEGEYGTVVTRLFRLFKPAKASEEGRFKSICCIPYFVIVILVFTCLIGLTALLAVNKGLKPEPSKWKVMDHIIIALLVIIGMALIGNIYTFCRMITNVCLSQRHRVQKITGDMETMKGENTMHALKREVELMSDFTRCMDSFLQNCTRLVVVVDGLDSCEQEKLLSVLDSVNMLFGDQNSPFIIILAIDPHVIIKGIEQNLQGLFRDASINGHDYLKNLVHLPFFLQSQALPPSELKPHAKREGSIGRDKSIKLRRQSTALVRQNSMKTDIRLSSTSLSELGKGPKKFKRHGLSLHQSGITHHPSTADLTNTVSKSSYFSDINPRNMRRLMNIVSVTGRLLRAYNIDFSWHKVASWIFLTEQWPYRSSWIILEAEEDTYEDGTALKKVYDNVLSKLPQSREIEPLLEIDKNPSKLLLFLTNHQPTLTVGDMKKFLVCTINVDPYLRKLIRELKENADNPNSENFGMFGPYGPESIAPGGTFSSYSRPRSRHGSGGMHTGTSMDRSSRIAGRGGLMVPQMPYSQMSMIPHLAAPMWNQCMSHSGIEQTHLGPSSSSKTFIKLKHLDHSIKLSRMSVEEVCNLMQKLVGLKDSVIPSLKDKIRENNISGVVLVACNLQELKPVLGLTFGDWEIFRSYIEALRDREDDGYDEEDSSAVDPVDTGRFDSKPPVSNSSHGIIAPKPVYGKDKEVGKERFKVQKVNIEDTSPSSEERHQLTTPDDKSTKSVMGEFMYESQTLHTVMSTMGIDDIDQDQSDNEDSIDENQTTVIRTESTARPLGTNIDWSEHGPNSNNSQFHSSVDSTLNEIFEEDPLIMPKKTKSKRFWSRSRSGSKNSLAKSESSVTSDLELATHEKKHKKKKGRGKNTDVDDEIVRLTSESDSDKVSLIMPGSSQERLFRQTSRGADGIGPSAFTSVTPVLSRASSGSAFSSHINSRHHSIDSLQADLEHLGSQQSSAYASRQGSASSSRRESLEASGGRKGGPSSTGNVDERELKEIVVEMTGKQSKDGQTSYL